MTATATATKRQRRPQGIYGERAELTTLARAVQQLNDAGQLAPCQQPGWRDAWISDRAADRRKAAEACRSCPLVEPCREAGRREHGGVWGGLDRTPTWATTPSENAPPEAAHLTTGQVVSLHRSLSDGVSPEPRTNRLTTRPETGPSQEE